MKHRLFEKVVLFAGIGVAALLFVIYSPITASAAGNNCQQTNAPCNDNGKPSGCHTVGFVPGCYDNNACYYCACGNSASWGCVDFNNE